MLLRGEELIWYILVAISWYVEEGHRNRKGTHEFTNDADEVRLGLPLLQYLIRIVSV